jgi:glycosyltransferase involved in cell wall biosynthesis
MPPPSLHVILLGPHDETDRTDSLSRITNLVYEQLRLRGIAVEKWHFNNSSASKAWLLLEKMFFFPWRLRLHLIRLQRQAPQSKIILHATDESFAYYAWFLRHHRFLWSCNDMLQIHRYTCPDSGRITNWFYRRLYRGIFYAKHISCISEETRRDLLALTHLQPERATTVHLSLNYPFTPMPKDESKRRLARLLPERLAVDRSWAYFTHVGANYPRKNRLGLLRIFSRLKCDPSFKGYYLITGGQKLDAEALAYIAAHDLGEWVISLENIDPEDLRALYSAAEALIFPSLQEGYGWPIVEAQACGCPVFATDRPPMNEVGGQAAVYFDPTDEDAASTIIRRHLPELDKIGRAGIANAASFSQEKMVEAYIRLYNEVL